MNVKVYDAGDGEYGDAGEVAVREYMKRNGYEAVRHPNGIYGEDVELESDCERFYIEVERTTERRWKGSSWFSFPTLHVLARRKVTPTRMFITLSADMSKAYVSFPDDLKRVEPVKMDNIHVQGEAIRDHDILRCLPLDLRQPINGSLARMNVERVRSLADQVSCQRSYQNAIRALRGKSPSPFGPPYGMDADEWNELVVIVENRSGLTAHVRRDPSRPSSRQATFAFDRQTP
jgi:hypothetical protein